MPWFSSSSEMPMISRPLALYLTFSSWSFGNDFLQGSHHVAQKSTMATFPLSDLSATLPLPLTDCCVKSGPGLPTRGCAASDAPLAPSPPAELPPHAPSANIEVRRATAKEE